MQMPVSRQHLKLSTLTSQLEEMVCLSRASLPVSGQLDCCLPWPVDEMWLVRVVPDHDHVMSMLRTGRLLVSWHQRQVQLNNRYLHRMFQINKCEKIANTYLIDFQGLLPVFIFGPFSYTSRSK